MSDLKLRPVAPEDREFLLHLYAETRSAEMSMVPWDEGLKRQFLDHQFTAQNNHYRERFPDASYDLILRDDEPVGRLYVLQTTDHIRILDLHVASTLRRNGIGTYFMNLLEAEARHRELPLRIYLEITSEHFPFFEHRGFRPIETLNDFHVLMEKAFSPKSP